MRHEFIKIPIHFMQNTYIIISLFNYFMVLCYCAVDNIQMKYAKQRPQSITFSCHLR